MSTSTHPNPKKKSLSIRLSESAVYLRTDGPGLRSRGNPDPRTSMLRGLLVLEITKPMKISSIDIELTATTVNEWPEGAGARRIEVNEEHRVFHASTTYFDATRSISSTRRTASIGPGVTFSSLDHSHDWDLHDEDDFEHPTNDASRDDHHIVTGPVEDRSNPTIVSSNLRRPLHVHASNTLPEAVTRTSRNVRRTSVDSHHFQSNPISYHEDWSDVPIPPYSPLDPGSPAYISSLLSIGDHSSVHLVPIRDDRSLSHNQDPAQDLEEFRASLNLNLRNLPQSSSVLSIRSNPDRSLSRVPMDDVPEDDDAPSSPRTFDELSDEAGQTSGQTSSGELLPSLNLGSGSGDNLPQATPRTPSYPRQNRYRNTSSEQAGPYTPGGISTSRSRDGRRSRSRFSLSSMADAFKDAVRSTSKSRLLFPSADRDSMTSSFRSRSRDEDANSSHQVRGRTMDRRAVAFGPDGDPLPPAGSVEHSSSPVPTPNSRSNTRTSKSRTRHTVDITRIFGSGFDLDKQRKEAGIGNGWKEFKKGTYTYPISFSIPSTAPPSMQTDFGSVVWRLCASVHRPGSFKQKLVVSRDVLMIACPTEEDTEDTENIIVERHWDDQLQYLISISGRSFHIGGVVPITFTLLPLAKLKIYRILVYIEEKVDYYTHMRQIARTDPITRFELLSVKHEGGRHAKYILPLDSDDVDALKNSPLHCMLNPEDDESEMASSVMGPGPWTLHQNIKLPNSCDTMRFSNKNRRANVAVSHTLKLSIRVERGDDLYLDKAGKRKLFDIVIQTPIQILSCRCNPEWISLPRYSETFNDDAPMTPNCPCQIRRMQEAHEHGALMRRIHHRHHHGHHHSSETPNSEGHEPANTHDTARTSAPAAMSALTPSTVDPEIIHCLQRQTDVSTLQTSQQFERLVAGFESEFGEPPPAYTPGHAPEPHNANTI